MATTQARLLSGRYRVESLSGHWIPWNREGLCALPGCWDTPDSHKGNIENFLLWCPSLSHTRQYLERYIDYFLQVQPQLSQLVYECLDTNPVQFWLDPSTMANVISVTQRGDKSILAGLFKLTRTYCHVLHKARMDMLDQDKM